MVRSGFLLAEKNRFSGQKKEGSSAYEKETKGREENEGLPKVIY